MAKLTKVEAEELDTLALRHANARSLLAYSHPGPERVSAQTAEREARHAFTHRLTELTEKDND